LFAVGHLSPLITPEMAFDGLDQIGQHRDVVNVRRMSQESIAEHVGR